MLISDIQFTNAVHRLKRCNDLGDMKCFRNWTSGQIIMSTMYQTFRPILFLSSFSDCAPKTPASQALDDDAARSCGTSVRPWLVWLKSKSLLLSPIPPAEDSVLIYVAE